MLREISRCVDVEPDEKVLEMSKFKEQKIIETFEITDEELIGCHEKRKPP